jgi:hypothetical protein
LAKLITHRRTLLVLDGLEPLQNPLGPQEGRVREPSLQALLRELAAFNTGLCVITTRLPVADMADHERTSALRRELEHLSSDSGTKLLRALGVKGPEAELRAASNEYSEVFDLKPTSGSEFDTLGQAHSSYSTELDWSAFCANSVANRSLHLRYWGGRWSRFS